MEGKDRENPMMMRSGQEEKNGNFTERIPAAVYARRSEQKKDCENTNQMESIEEQLQISQRYLSAHPGKDAGSDPMKKQEKE